MEIIMSSRRINGEKWFAVGSEKRTMELPLFLIRRLRCVDGSLGRPSRNKEQKQKTNTIRRGETKDERPQQPHSNGRRRTEMEGASKNGTCVCDAHWSTMTSSSQVAPILNDGSEASYLSRPLVHSDVISWIEPMARQELGSIFFCASMFFFAHNNWIQKGDDQQQWKKPRKRNVVGKKEKRKKQTAPRPMAAAGKNGGVLWRSSKRRFPDFGRCLHLRMSLFRLA